jgi:hypothetical protein
MRPQAKQTESNKISIQYVAALDQKHALPGREPHPSQAMVFLKGGQRPFPVPRSQYSAWLRKMHWRLFACTAVGFHYRRRRRSFPSDAFSTERDWKVISHSRGTADCAISTAPHRVTPTSIRTWLLIYGTTPAVAASTAGMSAPGFLPSPPVLLKGLADNSCKPPTTLPLVLENMTPVSVAGV